MSAPMTPEQVRAEVTAEFVAWLVKKAREHRARGPQYAKQADVIARLADKVQRGAVRPNNLLLLPPQGGPEDIPALRAELDQLRKDLEPYEVLNPQQCPAGTHADWLVDSEHTHACPWCEVDRLRAELTARPRQVTPVEAFAYDMDQALVDLSIEERRGADLVLQVLRARATAADVPTTEDAS